MSFEAPAGFEICDRGQTAPTDVQYSICNRNSAARSHFLVEVWSADLAAQIGFANGDFAAFRDQYLRELYPHRPSPLPNWQILRSDLVKTAGRDSLLLEGQKADVLRQEAWIALRHGQLVHFGIDGSPSYRAVFESTFSPILQSVAITD